MGSQVSGNLIGALVLKYGGQKTTLFLIFSGLAIAGSFLMCFLILPKKNNEGFLNPSGLSEDHLRFTDDP
jgi:hypothetical protein